MTAIIKSNFTDEQWNQAKELVVSRPDVSLLDISKTIGIPVSILENRAVKQNWMAKRDSEEQKINTRSLNRIIGEVALQLNDVHQHVSALMESLQYSHRIKIEQDEEGNLHYKNFEDFPGKPKKEEWETMSEEKKDAILHYIAPSRFARFMNDLSMILNLRNNNINFVSKMTKGGLPKVDPNILDLSRRDFDNKINTESISKEEEVKNDNATPELSK
jgi:hypothetical protein